MQGLLLSAIERDQIIIADGPAGTGKAQPLDALVLTAEGWKQMGEITTSDYVICPDNTLASVVGVFPQKERDIYRITFEDGRTAECCKEHLWKVWHPSTTNDCVAKYSIIDTGEILRLKGLKSYTNRLYVPLPEPVGREDNVPTNIDPYVLGCLIGDGGLTHAVSISSADDELISLVRGRLPEGYEIKHRSNYDYAIVCNSRSHDLKRQLIELGLFGHKSYTKFIPSEYVNSLSINQRWELLQGLMDTDGTADKSGSTQFCTVSYQLALDVQDLVRSLGGVCKLRRKKTSSCFGIAFILNIRVKTPERLFKLTRKVERVSNSNQYAKNLRLRIKSVEFLSRKEAQCIAVDHPDHLYITNDYVVTHNTYTSLIRGCEMLYEGYVNTLVLTRPNVETAKSLGALPGELEEKLDPYMKVMTGMIADRFSKGWLETNIKNGNIQLPALGFVQGATYDNSFVLIDEAEHLTPREMYIILTRLGENSKMVLCGDSRQKFSSGANGFDDATKRLAGINGFSHIEFTSDDIVRSGICKEIVKRYEG
jgi:phosphate starvation-inducible protein PhoH